MTRLARVLVINIGTLSTPWIGAMLKAGREANRRNIPVVMDPVGCGATRFRTLTGLRQSDFAPPRKREKPLTTGRRLPC